MHPRSSASLTALLWGLTLLVAVPTAAQDGRLYEGLRPLSSILQGDGTLAPDLASPGSFDPRGYRLTTTPTGEPQFVPEALAAEDGAWDDRFGLPGISFSEVHALLYHDGNLYAAGWISEAGALPIGNIARWDGRRWHQLGEGVEGTAYALAWYNGSLYVGGRIDKAGGILANGIARWDGTAWHAVGDGLIGEFGDPVVYALAVYDGALYVGGAFKEAGDVQAVGLARWNGAAWSAVGNVTSGEYGDSGEVYALAADATALYAGGRFTAISGVETVALASYNGTAWSALGGGVLGDDLVPQVMALALRDGRLYVGGSFQRADGRTVRNVAVWTRSTQTWAGLGQGMRGEFSDGEVRALLPLGNDLFAAGDFAFAGGIAAKHVARWDGQAWAPLAASGERGTNFAANALAAGPGGSVFVGGDFDAAGDLIVNHVTRYEAGRFYALGEGIHSGQTISGTVYAVATATDGKVYAAGQFRFAGSAVAENVAMWDGERWHPLGSGTDGLVFALATRGDDLFVGGRFTSAGGVAAQHIARWNATSRTWHALGGGINGYVYALAADAEWVYAAGDFTAAGGAQAEDLARWDGANWQRLGTGIRFNPNGVVHALLLDGDFVWVGGDILSVAVPGGFVDVNSLLVWKRSTDEWFTVGNGVTRIAGGSDVWGRVFSLAKLNGELYVGGLFDKAGGAVARSVARWDGANWAALGASVGGDLLQEVSALVTYGTDLYVAGRFRSAGAVESWGVARWNATSQTWTGLDGGLGGSDFVRGYALARHEQSVYVGGVFVTAGAGIPAAGFARWGITGTPPPPLPTFRMDPGRIDFPELVAGRVAEETVTITNVSGQATLTGEVGALAAPFSVVQGGGAFSLGPGQSRQVTVRFAPTEEGDFAATLSVAHNGANTASPATLPVSGRGASPIQTVTLRPFDPTSTQFFVAAQGDPQTFGFVFGTNAYLDRAKALAFTLPTGTTQGELTQVRAWFVYKKAGLADRPFTLHVYDGSMIAGPSGPPLYSRTYQMADIAADDLLSTTSGPTTFAFDQPVAVGETFYVAFDFGAYTAQEAAMVSLSNTAAMGRRVAEAWEQWDDNRWANVSDAWTGNQGASGSGRDGWYPWIEATLTTNTGTPTDPEGEATPTLLAQNAPNPFRDETRIAFTLEEAGAVSLRLYDVLGREVAVLVDETLPAGAHTAALRADALPSGTYVYALQTGSARLTRQLTVVH
jgi:trimeric autotransporter adhesin